MAITETYFDPDLATGSNDGTSEANAWQTWAVMEAGRGTGDRVNAKNPSSPFQPGTNITFAVSATDLLVSIFRGYGSTIGDGTKFQFDLQTNTLIVSGEGARFYDFDITGAYEFGASFAIAGDNSRAENGKVVNTSTTTNVSRAFDIQDATAKNMYIENNSTGSAGTACTLANGTLTNSVIVATRIGLDISAAFRQNLASDLLIFEKGSAATTGILVDDLAGSGGCYIKRCTIDGFTDLIDLNSLDVIAGTNKPPIIEDCILSNGTTGIANTDTATININIAVSDIAFYNISGSDTELGDNEVENKISLTADPYTDAANDDYSLNNTAGGGADVRAAGSFGAGEVANFVDIGAMQHEDSGGGGYVVAASIQDLGSGLIS